MEIKLNLLHVYIDLKKYEIFRDTLIRLYREYKSNQMTREKVDRIINEKDFKGRNILIKVLELGGDKFYGIPIVDYLIEMGSDVNCITKNETITALTAACNECSILNVKNLLDAGAMLNGTCDISKGEKKFNEADPYELLYAVTKNKPDVVHLLLEKNRIVNAYSKSDIQLAIKFAKEFGVKKECLNELFEELKRIQITFPYEKVADKKYFFQRYSSLPIQDILTRRKNEITEEMVEFFNITHIHEDDKLDSEKLFNNLKPFFKFKDRNLVLLRTSLMLEIMQGQLHIFATSKPHIDTGDRSKNVLTNGIIIKTPYRLFTPPVNIFVSKARDEQVLQIFTHECIHSLFYSKLVNQNRELILAAIGKTEYNIMYYKEQLFKDLSQADIDYYTKLESVSFVKSIIASSIEDFAPFNIVKPDDRIMEEFIANIGIILVYAEQHPDRKKVVYEIAAPLIEFFENKMAPMLQNRIKEYIAQYGVPTNMSFQVDDVELGMTKRFECAKIAIDKLAEIKDLWNTISACHFYMQRIEDTIKKMESQLGTDQQKSISQYKEKKEELQKRIKVMAEKLEVLNKEFYASMITGKLNEVLANLCGLPSDIFENVDLIDLYDLCLNLDKYLSQTNKTATNIHDLVEDRNWHMAKLKDLTFQYKTVNEAMKVPRVEEIIGVDQGKVRIRDDEGILRPKQDEFELIELTNHIDHTHSTLRSIDELLKVAERISTRQPKLDRSQLKIEMQKEKLISSEVSLVR